MTDEVERKERLLAAAVRLYAKLDAQQLFRGLNPGAVAREADYTRGNFYHHFPGQAAFWNELAEYVTRTGMRTDDPVVATDESYLPNITTKGHPVRDIIRETQLRDFHSIDGGDFRVRLGLASKASPDNEIGQLIGANQREWTDKVKSVGLAGLAAWRREPRPPFSIEDIFTVIAACLDGFALRRITDPVSVPDEMITETILLITLMFTRPVGDDTTMDDITAPIEDFPMAAAIDEDEAGPAAPDEASHRP